MGLRGSQDGSYTVAHAMKDSQFRTADYAAQDTGERYDLIVVGGGISGLAAAWFYRARAGGNSRILILDNHDDFGGHARRNEFRVADRLLLGYGGTQSIQSPAKYSRVARTLLTDLGIETERFYTAFDRKFYDSLGLKSGLFFDREVFGLDHLAVGVDDVPWPKLLEGAPISPQVREDIERVYQENRNYMPGLNSRQKKALLAKTSYQDYLREYVKVAPARPRPGRTCRARWPHSRPARGTRGRTPGAPRPGAAPSCRRRATRPGRRRTAGPARGARTRRHRRARRCAAARAGATRRA